MKRKHTEEDGLQADPEIAKKKHKKKKHKKEKSESFIDNVQEELTDQLEESLSEGKKKINKNKNKTEKTEVVAAKTENTKSDVTYKHKESKDQPEENLSEGKKIKKKNKKKNQTEKTEKEAVDKPWPDAGKESIDYLLRWKSDRQNWAFRKRRQVWLLRNIYNQDKISDANFEVLLEYMESIEGNSKVMTIRQAEEQMAKHDQQVEKSDSKEDVAESLAVTRARQVLQSLN